MYVLLVDFYSVNYNKELNNKLLPHAKLVKKLPTIIEKETFIAILNEEKNLKHKCWLLLGYCSCLRIEEVVRVKIKDINSKEHELKIYGKSIKELKMMMKEKILRRKLLKFLKRLCHLLKK